MKLSKRINLIQEWNDLYEITKWEAEDDTDAWTFVEYQYESQTLSMEDKGEDLINSCKDFIDGNESGAFLRALKKTNTIIHVSTSFMKMIVGDEVPGYFFEGNWNFFEAYPEIRLLVIFGLANAITRGFDEYQSTRDQIYEDLTHEEFVDALFEEPQNITKPNGRGTVLFSVPYDIGTFKRDIDYTLIVEWNKQSKQLRKVSIY